MILLKKNIYQVFLGKDNIKWGQCGNECEYNCGSYKNDRQRGYDKKENSTCWGKKFKR